MARIPVKLKVLLTGLVAALRLFAAQPPEVSVPILVYHRVSNGKPGNTTVTPEHFRSQLETLRDHRFHVIPLADLIAWKSGKGPAPQPMSVVITFDDGHESFFTEAQPIIDEFHVPVTQFLVAGCIQAGGYCVNWEQVSKLAQDPLINLESHTWTHPTFTHEIHRRSPASYTRLVDFELTHSHITLEEKLKRPVPWLAWPYGIYDPMLLRHAEADGYKAGFSIECRSVTAADPMMAIPRCMVLNSDVGDDLLRFLTLADEAAKQTPVNRKWRIVPVPEARRTKIE
jgi:peptidoglycan/xylan/chitin deacetylase (PgdA/CDA1 family)